MEFPDKYNKETQTFYLKVTAEDHAYFSLLVTSLNGQVLLHDGVPQQSEINNVIMGEKSFIIDLPSMESYPTDDFPMKVSITQMSTQFSI